MKADITRVSFDQFKHFSRVLRQQGRVTLDADPNEQTEILLHYLRTLTQDLFGHCARPVNDFKLTYTGASVSIGVGHCYVDGILCENDSPCDYGQQWDYTPDPQTDPLLKALAAQQQSGTFGLYLDVWERHVSAVEDDDIREKALGGPDTCTRSKIVWQVRAIPVAQGATCDAILNNVDNLPRPKLNAQLDPGAAPKDPCTLSPDARYRGAENQLYRVEIHTGGQGSQATFKWSRDNGSVLTSWIQTSGNDLVVGSTRGFTAGNWVELIDDDTELRGEPGTLVKLTKVQADRLTVEPSTLGGPLPSIAQLKHPRVRRWDEFDNPDGHASLANDNAIGVIESDPANPTWITLEDGIEIQFIAVLNANYKTGDYWLIPARVATGQIEWPPSGDDPNAPFTDGTREPLGIDHHYAALAVLKLAGPDTTTTMCPCLLNPVADCTAKSQVTTPNDLTGNHAPVRPAPAPAPLPAPRTIPRRRTPGTSSP